MFSVEYESESGEVIVTGSNGDKVIAPGVSENYELRLRNTDGSAINFELTPVVSYTSEYSIPLYFKMYDEDGKYLIGSENKWVSVEEMEPISDFKTLARAKSEEYVLQWKWDYESGNDALDTELGINAGSEDIGVKVELHVITEANTDIEANKEIIYMGIVSGALILVFVVTAIVFIKKKRAGTI